MKVASLLLWSTALVGCGSTPLQGGDDLSMGNNGPGPFAGTWAMTLNESVTVTGLGTAPLTGSGTMVFAPGTTTDMVEMLTAPGTNSSCTFTYARTGNTATAFPADQTCSGVLPNGSHQTNTDSTHSAVINGTTLTVTIAGTFIGTTAGGTAYSGSFQGAWTGTKQ